MFEFEFASVADAAVVAAIEECARAEAVAAARRLSAIAELKCRRVGTDNDDPRDSWACDWWDCAAAEVGAAMNISSRKASGQMRVAVTLRDHLPLVAAMFRRGELSARVVGAITWRTSLITEAAVWARVDGELTERASSWGPLSEDRLIAAVDALVLEFDACAVIAAKSAQRTRDFVVGKREDENGVTSVWGRLNSADAAALKKKIAALVTTVCAEDPRSAHERRADALGAWSEGNDHLPCACDSPKCPARESQPVPMSSVVVNVYTDQATLDTVQQGEQPAAAPEIPAPETPAPTPPAPATPATPTPASSGTALLSGTEVLPTALLDELLRNGAKLRPLCTPGSESEARYRPSAGLARFVRARDLTCRFPGCTTPAESCDIDHVIPYPLGATHASNLMCLCRKHHHLKTFWTGDWAVRLLPDGAAVWTSPSGHTFTTQPGSRTFFPDWNTNTGDLPPPPTPQTFSTDRGIMMPLRKRTRAQDREARIKAEREQNSDPPPF